MLGHNLPYGTKRYSTLGGCGWAIARKPSGSAGFWLWAKLQATDRGTIREPQPCYAMKTMIAELGRHASLHKDEVQRSALVPPAGRQARGAKTARFCRCQ
jgi:hypothetical protein